MKVVFLDLDGTLTDSGVGIINCLNYALEKMEMAHLSGDTDWVVGPPLWDTFRTLGVTEEKLEHAVALYRERYADKGYLENDLYLGILDQLKLLYDMGYTLCLATSKKQSYAVKITKHFGIAHYLSYEFGSEADGTHADKPSLIAHGLKQTGCDPNQAIMVGDREYDVLGAKANGILSLGVSYGYGTRNELITSGVDNIISTPHELANAITQLLPIEE